jgi:hypothetical protein
MTLPLIDTSVLETLAAEVGEAAAERFARGVVRLWPQRRARLAATLAGGQRAAAVEAALSLRTAASMAGALRLAAAAGAILELVRSDGPRAALPLLAETEACGDLTAAVLARGLAGSRISRPRAAACSPLP